MKNILLLFAGFLLIIILSLITGKIINAYKFKIRSKKGIQKTEYITIGQIQQYIQIRGQDISNPIILMLHGGPGNNMAYYSYYWQADLERDYTIVNWDQRGCGNTYYRNKDAQKPTLDLLLQDLDELVDHIRSEYHKEKITIMGHSWGTFLGGIYSGTHPEKISAYIPIGQMLDFKKSEQVSAREAMRLADAAGKPKDAQKIEKKLELIMSCQTLDKQNAKEFLKFRQLKEKYLPSQYSNKMLLLQLFSPYMTFRDFKWMINFNALIESNSELYQALLSDERSSMYNHDPQFKVPVILIAGADDWTTPYSMALNYFNHISPPVKELITIENTGHLPFIDKAGEFSEMLLKTLDDVWCRV